MNQTLRLEFSNQYIGVILENKHDISTTDVVKRLSSILDRPHGVVLTEHMANNTLFLAPQRLSSTERYLHLIKNAYDDKQCVLCELSGLDPSGFKVVANYCRGKTVLAVIKNVMPNGNYGFDRLMPYTNIF